MSNEDEIQSAVSLLNRNKKSEAILLLKGMLKSNRDNRNAWLLLSTCMNDQKDVDYCIREALRGNPDNSLIKMSLEQLGSLAINRVFLERIYRAILRFIKPKNEIAEKIERLNTTLKGVTKLADVLGILIVLYVVFVFFFSLSSWKLLEQTVFLAFIMIPLYVIASFAKYVLRNKINLLEPRLGIKPEIDLERRLLERRLKENFDRISKKYSEVREALNIPTDVKQVNCIKNSQILGCLFVWKTINELCFFPNPPLREDFISDYEKRVMVKLPFERIEYFSAQGEVFRENIISGGGGGGSSVAGAVIGGAIAGAPGAIIGSRKDVKDIQSKLVTHDTRETVISYFDETNQRRSMFFDLDAFEVFNDLIPEKEASIVKAVKSSILVKQELDKADSQNITGQIRNLAKLRDEGLLTEEEFAEKKKILLAKIQ